MNDPGLVQSILDFVAQHAHGLGPVVLFSSSLIEYVLPPFPGDVVTLFGTYLVVKGLWSFAFTLGLVTTGSLVGAALDYWIGAWLGRRLHRLPSEREVKGWTPLTREKYELVLERFNRHGAAYILINRFLPGIRAFFFVVAGAARMSLFSVLLYAGISAVAWNAAILACGYTVGANWERLRSLFESYTIVVWCVLGCLAATLVIWWALKKRRFGRGEANEQ
jgi:membrane protein DedA with SNARE-associated domain